MHVSVTDYLVAFAAVGIGALVQGSIGFGLNLLSAPFVALVQPTALPASLLLLALPVSTTTAVRERHALDRSVLRWLLLAAVPGTILGSLVVGVVSASTLAVIVGAVALFGVAASVFSPPIRVHASTAAAAGFISALTGTAAAVGGPPVALLYQHHEGPVVRSTLGTYFCTAGVMSLVGLLIVGKVNTDQVWFALALTPAMIGGLWLSHHARRVVDRGWFRAGVLTLCAIAGAAAIYRGLS